MNQATFIRFVLTRFDYHQYGACAVHVQRFFGTQRFVSEVETYSYQRRKVESLPIINFNPPRADSN